MVIEVCRTVAERPLRATGTSRLPGLYRDQALDDARAQAIARLDLEIGGQDVDGRSPSRVLTLGPAGDELVQPLQPEDGHHGAADVIDQDQTTTGLENPVHLSDG